MIRRRAIDIALIGAFFAGGLYMANRETDYLPTLALGAVIYTLVGLGLLRRTGGWNRKLRRRHSTHDVK